VQQFVRTGAHDDAIGGNAVQRAQRGAQILAVGIGIARRFPAPCPAPPRAASTAALVPSGFSFAESLISGRLSAPVDLPGT
jgi:hypothetical protein